MMREARTPAVLPALGVLLTLAAAGSATATFAASPSLEARLQRLEDEKAIERLLLEYGRTLDARDFANAAGDIPKGGNYHIMSNFVIEVLGDRATAKSMFTFYKMDGSKPVAEVAGRYEDTLIRENGAWRFLQRNALPPG